MIPAPLASLDLLYLAREDHARTGSAWLGVIKTEAIPAMAKTLLAAGFHLEDVSGLDAVEGAVVAYHFDHFDKPGRITLLAVAPHDKPVFPSIAPVFQGAEWHERETRDFYGYVFTGNPNLVPLLLADDMVDIHPLKKAEEARAPLRVLFAAENRSSKVVKKADDFTLFDPPAPPAGEAPAKAKQTAPGAGGKTESGQTARPAQAKTASSDAGSDGGKDA